MTHARLSALKSLVSIHKNSLLYVQSWIARLWHLKPDQVKTVKTVIYIRYVSTRMQLVNA